MIIVGVDPGKRGAIAFIDSTGLAAVHDMPVDLDGIAGVLSHTTGLAYGRTVCVIEQQWVRAEQKAQSDFLIHVGEVRGIAHVLGYELVMVSPQKWKRDMGVAKNQIPEGVRPKDASRAKAAELWPEQADLFKRVKDDGRAESALIAEWFRRYGTGSE